jgi:Amt family ammonium transporter
VSQLIGTALGVIWGLVMGFVIYSVLKAVSGIRLDPEEEFAGADLSIHKISSTAENDLNW